MSRHISLILGRTGCGKTYLGKEIQKKFSRRIVFDTMHEYPGRGVRNFEEFAERLKFLNSHPTFEIVVQFDAEVREVEAEVSECFRLCFYAGNCLVVVEEVQSYARPTSMDHWLEQILLKGRHRAVSLLAVTQRPGVCHKTIISQANHVYFGQLHERNDLDYCASILDGREGELKTIPPRKFLYFSPGLPITFVDSSKVGLLY